MTKVLFFVTVYVLCFSGSSLRAASFVQTQSNIDSVDEELNTTESVVDGKMPIMTIPGLDLNLFSQTIPLPILAPQPSQIMIRVNVFPVLSYSTKNFMDDMVGSDDLYHQTMQLDGVTLTSRGGPFHLTTLDGKIIADGSSLSFKITKKTSVFTLDHKTANFIGLILTQNPESVTKVSWLSNKGPVTFNYIGNFVITPEMTPRNGPCVKIVNVLELERYVSLVTPAELEPDGMPLAVLEAQATAARTYALGKIEERRKQKSDFDIFGSVQDQFLRGVTFEKDKDKIEKRQPENALVLKAVTNTSNKVLFHGGHIAGQAMYSANCAGRSVSYQDYSQGKLRIAYLVSVPEYNKANLRKLSTGTAVFNFTTQALANQVRAAGISFTDAQVLEVDPINLNSSDRAMALRIRGPASTIIVPTSGQQFTALRRSFVKFAVSKADTELRTYMDSAIAVGGDISIKSYGVGHNVGFCQEGGVLMAESAMARGKDDADLYKRILAHYYKGTTVDDYVNN